jgi:ribonuclease D
MACSSSLGAEHYVYIRGSAELKPLIEQIAASESVGLDTEADSLHSYFEKICLLQLSVAGGNYLVDPLAALDLSGLLGALADKQLIVHGGDYDLRMLRSSLGFRPRRDVFDTMIAAQLLGIEQIGLGALLERCLGIKIGKAQQKSDWSVRPLSEKQLRYAMNDTCFLEPLAKSLSRELRERGRLDWHRESCRAMVASTAQDRPRDPEQAWRIKGSPGLTRRQLAYLRELWHWRDRHAQSANVPPFKILGNEQILDLVRWLDSHPGLPRDRRPELPRNIRSALLRSLEETIARGARVKPDEWPEPRKLKRPDAPPPDVAKSIEALRRECALIAAKLQIAAPTLAPKAALEAIARSRPRTIDEIVENAGLLRWQAELIHGAVERCLHAAHR